MKEFIETKLFFHSIADSWSDNFKQPKSNFKILQSYFVVFFLDWYSILLRLKQIA